MHFAATAEKEHLFRSSFLRVDRDLSGYRDGSMYTWCWVGVPASRTHIVLGKTIYVIRDEQESICRRDPGPNMLFIYA